MRVTTVTASVLLLGLTLAQTPQLPSCANSCITQFTSGSSIGGCNNLDIACICGSPQFISGIACCLAATCSASDQAAAVQYAQSLCKTAGVTVPNAVSCSSSGSAPPATSSSAGSSASSASSAATSSSAGSSSGSSSPSPSGSSSASAAPASTTSSPTSSAAASATKNAGVQNLVDTGVGLAGGLAAALALL